MNFSHVFLFIIVCWNLLQSAPVLHQSADGSADEGWTKGEK